jgi:hypothetical protein
VAGAQIALTADRLFLIDGLRRVLDGGSFTNDELFSGVADPLALDEFEKTAWECLSHWADDDDVRAKDPGYEARQREKVAEALADLEALEVAYLPQEVRRGEHTATHVPVWAALLALSVIVGLAWVMFR